MKTKNPGTRRKHTAILPLGALAAGFGLSGLALAQTAPPSPTPEPVKETVMPVVRAKAAAEPAGKDSVRSKTTNVGKGTQELRDIPQSVTVVTEKLIDDRNLDTLKDTLRTTAGISFQAAEGGEEDIRLRGFALQSTGDIFLDGIRDPGFYERDSFNWDRLEVLRGSASLLFGRGSTGGAVNQVNKQPTLFALNEVAVTLGSGSFFRATADINQKVGDAAAVRVNALVNTGNDNGLKIDKIGFAPSVRLGIGTADEVSLGLYHLEYKNGINYGMPWLNNQVSKAFEPDAYYGATSDYTAGGTTYGTLGHLHRFGNRSELKTVLRVARYERDQRASPIRFANATLQPGGVAVSAATIGANTVLTRGANAKIQNMDSVYLQSDYSGTLKAWGLTHNVLAGADVVVEDFTRFAAVTPLGVTIPAKPTTTLGNPNAIGSVDETLRDVRRSQQFDAEAVGLYAQDLIQLNPSWKLLGALRFDRFEGDYRTYATANPSATNTVPVGTEMANRARSDGLWSRRFAVLYQPSPTLSWHASYGTSFNTSGDTYSFDALGSNTPPEKSRNIELGGSIDWAEGRFTTRFALFHATKYNERNRDETSVTPTNYVLSGQRHAAGVDLDFAGRLNTAWELWASYSFIPDAEVDRGATNGTTLIQGEVVGERPAMTPRHSGSVWTTYKLNPSWRVGFGLTARSSMNPLLSQIAAPKAIWGDAMVEYTMQNATMKLHISNLTDKLYADQLYRGHWIQGKGRTVQLTSAFIF